MSIWNLTWIPLPGSEMRSGCQKISNILYFVNCERRIFYQICLLVLILGSSWPPAQEGILKCDQNAFLTLVMVSMLNFKSTSKYPNSSRNPRTKVYGYIIVSIFYLHNFRMGLTSPHSCTCPKPGPGFPTFSFVLSVWIWKIDIGGFVDHHCLNCLSINKI
jgi:hypothetical protein